MSLKNCPRCGKTYSDTGVRHHICPECIASENKDLQRITTYLKKSPLANPMEVCEATGVPLSNVMRLVSRGAIRQT